MFKVKKTAFRYLQKDEPDDKASKTTLKIKQSFFK